MTGTVLSAFNDFAEATGSTYVQSPKKISNLAGRHAYFWSRLFSNNKETVRGGEDLRFHFIAKPNGTYEEYLPGAYHNWTNPQRLQKGVAQWRFTMVHMSWVDQEILLNDKIRYGQEQYVFEAFVDLRNEKEMMMWTEKAEGMENALWRQPNVTLMEGTGASAISPYSIFVFCNTHANGLFPSYTPGGAWTVVEEINPASADVDGKFTNQVSTYSSSVQDNPNNIIGGLDDLWMDLQFEAPSMLKAYFENPALNNQMFLTTKFGRKTFMGLLRAGQDRFVAGNQDPAYPDPQMHGVPVRRCDALETAAVYANAGATALVTERDATGANIGPVFYGLNGNYLFPIVHDERYFFKDKPSRHHNIPDTWVMPVATWWQLFCKSRKHQGILRPSGTGITAYA